MIYDHQTAPLPTERSEGGSQSNAPLPVAGGGALLCCAAVDIFKAAPFAAENIGHRKRS